jgi:hypothetical protein
MISIDWQSVIAYLLLSASGLGGIGYAAHAAWTKFRSLKPAEPKQRAADEPAPPGAVEWVQDIDAAMGDAPDTSKLAALKAGATRDTARSLRIAELEAKP